jgi:phosphocarrier protein FPr
MTVGLVVVSHSRPLALAAVELAVQMTANAKPPIAIAAGLSDGGFGTDAVQITLAIRTVDQGDGVVVLMDIGSAVLSAELALELLDEDARKRVILCPAPLIEGIIVATVTAATGAPATQIVSEAINSLAGKQSQLAMAFAPHRAVADGDELTGMFVINSPYGLHARSAAQLVARAGGHDSRTLIRNRTTRSAWVSANSLSAISTLATHRGDELEVRVTGIDAAVTLSDVLELAANNFGEH